jgi:hypothetical protein
MRDVASRFLAGETIRKLAREHGLKEWALRFNLKERCGETWTQTFHSAKLGIHEDVPTTVPRILDDATVRAVRERLAAGSTYLRKGGRRVNNYLLSGLILCDHCGGHLCGRTDRHSRTYYEHSSQSDCTLSPRPRVPAAQIEEEVVTQLYDMFNSRDIIERAVAAATPDMAKERQRLARLQGLLATVAKKKANVIDAVADGLLTRDQVRAKVAALDAEEADLHSQLADVETSLEGVPDPAAVKVLIRRCEGGFGLFRNGERLTVEEERAYVEALPEKVRQQRRTVLEAVFSGRALGRPNGIYVSREGEQRRYHSRMARSLRANARWSISHTQPPTNRPTASAASTFQTGSGIRGRRRGGAVRGRPPGCCACASRRPSTSATSAADW